MEETYEYEHIHMIFQFTLLDSAPPPPGRYSMVKVHKTRENRHEVIILPLRNNHECIRSPDSQNLSNSNVKDSKGPLVMHLTNFQ